MTKNTRNYVNGKFANGFDACHMGLAAKAACKALHMTPRWFEPINSSFDINDDQEYPVMRIWNSKRELILTNRDMDYADRYLR